MQDQVNSNGDLPKPQFSAVGRLYLAAVSVGETPSNLNLDRADSIVRTLSRTNWKKDNLDIYSTWAAGGDPWSQLIKDVKAYSKIVSAHQRKKKKPDPKQP